MANGPAQDSLHQIQKLNKRFHRLGKAKLKYVSEIADSKASFEGDLAVKNRKLKRQSTSTVDICIVNTDLVRSSSTACVCWLHRCKYTSKFNTSYEMYYCTIDNTIWQSGTILQ